MSQMVFVEMARSEYALRTCLKSQHMLCIPITGSNLSQAAAQIGRAILEGDILELRLDLFEPYTLEELKQLRQQITTPLIFTLRKVSQGGGEKRDERARLDHLLQLAHLSPTYLDLEYDLPVEFVETLYRRFPEIKLIISYHNFDETPSDLARISHTFSGQIAALPIKIASQVGEDSVHATRPRPLERQDHRAECASCQRKCEKCGLEIIVAKMRKFPEALYKIACHANTTFDSLRMLHFIQENAPVLGMCMGEKGEVSRILGPLVGACWTYAALDRQTAPGQLTSGELRSVYAHHKLTSTSTFYGLIGDPLVQSVSHLRHNFVLQALGIDAVYVKMVVKQGELAQFLTLAKQIGCCGLSVTMPLKEAIIPFLDQCDVRAQEIGAVNTLVVQNGRLIGYNTDGRGALDAIEAKLKVDHTHMAVVGAGGAARAIIHEALLRGALVSVYNRTSDKAFKLAKMWGIEGGGLDRILKKEYDILVNTTPDPLPIPKEAIRPGSLVMDINNQAGVTPLLEAAAAKNCHLVFGHEMFINQAVEQYALWFQNSIDRQQVSKLFYHAVGRSRN
jgi:3-dehydroquinate dehydratase / shikimate dehydrogenase